MLQTRPLILRLFAALALTSGAACATTDAPADMATTPLAAASVQRAEAPLGAAAATPTGFLDFCRRTPEDCVEADEVVELAEISRRAADQYWAEVFGTAGGQPTPAARTPRTARFDWSGVFGTAAATDAAAAAVAVKAVGADQAIEGAISAEDMAPTAVAVVAVDEDGAVAAADMAVDAAAVIPAPVVERVALPMNDAVWKQVRAVNRQVNRAIRHQADQKTYGAEDRWIVPENGRGRGDCEDYVLTKRRALIAGGVPATALSIALVRTAWGEDHAVLLIATDEGDFVLDNLSPWISRWDQVDYEWLRRQAPGRVFDWVDMAA